MKKYILASASPRRSEILSLLGIDFDIIPSSCDERSIHAATSKELAEALSAAKCADVAANLAGKKHIVIGADTIVVLDGEIFGKPKDSEDAVKMLSRLCGRTHIVYTGVTITNTETGKIKTFSQSAKVSMAATSAEEIKAYVATKEPLDKAGAYAVQGKGAFLIEKIDGDFYTVMGLPAARLYRELQSSFPNDMYLATPALSGTGVPLSSCHN